MAYLTDYQYYENNGQDPQDKNWGSYQYIELKDIVNDFMMMNVGNGKHLNNVNRYEVIYQAKQAIKKLNYDALREIKVIELSVSDTTFSTVLPPDYVGLIRMSVLIDGILRPLIEDRKNKYAVSYLQDNQYNVLFDNSGGVLKGTSTVDEDRVNGKLVNEYYKRTPNSEGKYAGTEDDRLYTVGKRFGVDTSVAFVNPTFSINKSEGVIYFDSDMSDATLVLEYVSDGMEGGVNTDIKVNKFFEDYIKAKIAYEIGRTRVGVQEYVVNDFKRRQKAEYNNAKIRIANMRPSDLLQALRGRDKTIK
jgi:hypothetical protein